MKKIYCLLVLLFCSQAIFAQLPQRGALMASIEAEFGSPLSISPAVGEPPITRWFYDNFTVIFEYDHVVHAFSRNRTVEDLSAKNTDGLIMPDPANQQNETEVMAETTVVEEPVAENEVSTPEEIIPFSDGDPLSSGSFFENTPDLIKR